MEKERKLVGRIHRLEGQVRALERVLAADDYIQTITQFEAVIAAAKASLAEYVEIALTDSAVAIETKQKIIARLVKTLK